MDNSEQAQPDDRSSGTPLDPDDPHDASTPGGDGGSSDDDEQPDDAGETGTLGDRDVT